MNQELLLAKPELFICRHGQTDWNAEGRLQGQVEVPLNDTGRAQARRNGRHLLELLGDRARDYAYLASPLGRASETMRIIRTELGLDPDDQNRIIDIRYSMVPNQIDALWGIELDETASFDAHVRFFTSRSLSKEQRAELQRMLFGS